MMTRDAGTMSRKRETSTIARGQHEHTAIITRREQPEAAGGEDEAIDFLLMQREAATS